MGVLAEAVVAYARPLLDDTDGSLPQLQLAMNIAQICWNLALAPEEDREQFLDEAKRVLKMSDEEFADFREHIVLPMIQRHYLMFPALHEYWDTEITKAKDDGERTTRHPETGRNDPCPCGSGRKYKKCCGAKK